MRTAVLLLVLIGPVSAAPAIGQVVQLPTFDSFSVNTTVSVPDRGSVYLGGVDRARYESSWSGVPGMSRLPGAGPLLGNRASSASVTSSGATATATIIDHREWDAATRARAAQLRRNPRTDDPVARKAAFLSQHVGRRPTLPRGGPAKLENR